jgi:hypothetical protein
MQNLNLGVSMKRIAATAIMVILSHACSTWAVYPELAAVRTQSLQNLRKLSEVLTSVDAKFVGVISFGKAIGTAHPENMAQVDEITLHNPDYWRAMMEMAPGDPAILFAHAYLLACAGEVDYADVYMALGSLNMSKDFISHTKRWQDLTKALRDVSTGQIKKGIALNDSKKYKEAISVYDDVLTQYPCCAWAMYEKGLTIMLMNGTKGAGKSGSAAMFAACRLHDPFRWQAYQGSDQKVLSSLPVLLGKVIPYYSGEKRTPESFNDFAEGCEEIGLFQIAAVCQWRLANSDSSNQKRHLIKYLSLMEKCGCPNMPFFRAQFALEGADEPARQEK